MNVESLRRVSPSTDRSYRGPGGTRRQLPPRPPTPPSMPLAGLTVVLVPEPERGVMVGTADAGAVVGVAEAPADPGAGADPFAATVGETKPPGLSPTVVTVASGLTSDVGTACGEVAGRDLVAPGESSPYTLSPSTTAPNATIATVTILPHRRRCCGGISELRVGLAEEPPSLATMISTLPSRMALLSSRLPIRQTHDTNPVYGNAAIRMAEGSGRGRSVESPKNTVLWPCTNHWPDDGRYTATSVVPLPS